MHEDRDFGDNTFIAGQLHKVEGHAGSRVYITGKTEAGMSNTQGFDSFDSIHTSDNRPSGTVYKNSNGLIRGGYHTELGNELSHAVVIDFTYKGHEVRALL